MMRKGVKPDPISWVFGVESGHVGHVQRDVGMVAPRTDGRCLVPHRTEFGYFQTAFRLKSEQ